MSLMKIPFSPKSKYVQSVISKLKRENKFHIEESEEVINIEDFFEELLNMVDKEREGRNKNQIICTICGKIFTTVEEPDIVDQSFICDECINVMEE